VQNWQDGQLHASIFFLVLGILYPLTIQFQGKLLHVIWGAILSQSLSCGVKTTEKPRFRL